MQANRCVTIDRQYGSGGREVGRRLAQKLSIPCYGKELLLITAADFGVDIKKLKEVDERRTGSLLHDIAISAFGLQNYNKMMEPSDIFKEVNKTIVKLAEKGPCIFIGRCADIALQDVCKPLRVFVYATSMEERIRRAQKEDQVDDSGTEKYILKKDEYRRGYYNHFSGKEWGDIQTYDICLNTTAFGYDGCVDILAELLQK